MKLSAAFSFLVASLGFHDQAFAHEAKLSSNEKKHGSLRAGLDLPLFDTLLHNHESKEMSTETQRRLQLNPAQINGVFQSGTEVIKSEFFESNEGKDDSHDNHDAKVENLSPEQHILRFTRAVALLTDEKQFGDKYGYNIATYLENRDHFATSCMHMAKHMRFVRTNAKKIKVIADAGELTSSSIGTAGLILAPYTMGWSMSLTAASMYTGLVSAGVAAAGEIWKDIDDNMDTQKMEAKFDKFSKQDRDVAQLFKDINEDVKFLRSSSNGADLFNWESGKLMEEISKDSSDVGSVVDESIHLKAYTVASRIGKSTENIDEISATVAAQSELLPAMIGTKNIFSEVSKTTVLFASSFEIFREVSDALSVINEVKDWDESKKADGYETFANDYEKQTKQFRKDIEKLKYYYENPNRLNEPSEEGHFVHGKFTIENVEMENHFIGSHIEWTEDHEWDIEGSDVRLILGPPHSGLYHYDWTIVPSINGEYTIGLQVEDGVTQYLQPTIEETGQTIARFQQTRRNNSKFRLFPHGKEGSNEFLIMLQGSDDHTKNHRFLTSQGEDNASAEDLYFSDRILGASKWRLKRA